MSSIKNRIFGADIPLQIKRKVEALQKLNEKDRNILNKISREYSLTEVKNILTKSIAASNLGKADNLYAYIKLLF